MRRGTRLHRPRGSRGKTGLLSTIGPVAVGVLLAFAWNMAVSQQQEISGYVTPAVSSTVEQAAAQAWATSTPRFAAAAEMDSTVSVPAVTAPARTNAVTPARPAVKRKAHVPGAQTVR